MKLTPRRPTQTQAPVAPRSAQVPSHKPAIVKRAVKVCVQATLLKPSTKVEVPALQTTPNHLVEECSSSEWNTCLYTSDAVVALGKFDALHRGHQSLAKEAAQLGDPVLVSFSGMAQVLGWPDKLPLVAPCDRSSVLQGWASVCQGKVPRQRNLPFQDIRSMSPYEFVRVLAEELKAKGIVAGSNYRFGFKAAGDAAELQRLGSLFGLKVSIMDLLSAECRHDLSRRISSSKIRQVLALGDVQSVGQLMGRKYRLVCKLDSPEDLTPHKGTCTIPSSCYQNQPPAPGWYSAAVEYMPDPVGCNEQGCTLTDPHPVLVTESGIQVDTNCLLSPAVVYPQLVLVTFFS